MKEELLKGLTEEQIAKIKACKNQEEVLRLAKEEGLELTNEQLEAVAGGCETPKKRVIKCECGSTNVQTTLYRNNITSETVCKCLDCGKEWYD